MDDVKFQDRAWEKEYLVADADLRIIFCRCYDVDDARRYRNFWRQERPNLHIVIFERISLTTWQGKFIAQEATIHDRERTDN